MKSLIKILKKKKFKISVAESCTGGLLASKITSVSGASKVFTIGFITYSNQSKIDFLKIPKKIIKKYGSVSEIVCLMMVKNLNRICKTNISLSITGIAGPNGATKNKPIGLVYIGIKKDNKIAVKKFLLKNKGRLFIQKLIVNKSLNLILNIIK